MKIISRKINLSTKGNGEIINITDYVQSELKNTKISTGIVTVFIPGSTGAVAAMEYEPGLINDTKDLFKKTVPESNKYSHDSTHTNNGNAVSHLRASLVSPSITIPFEDCSLSLGTWQQVVFIDFDNRPRDRKILLKIIGE